MSGYVCRLDVTVLFVKAYHTTFDVDLKMLVAESEQADVGAFSQVLQCVLQK